MEPRSGWIRDILYCGKKGGVLITVDKMTGDAQNIAAI